MYAKKSLGQYFLRCRWALSTLVKAADLKSKDTVLEIGPGTGTLTRELAKYAGRVIAAEKDEKFAESLRWSLKKERVENVEIITGDILKLLGNQEFSHKLQATSYKLVANIPYYLTSRLLRILLEGDSQPELIVLTVQKEVAQRITAKPPKMNLLALSVQAFGKPELVKNVPAQCFHPRPKVDSAIIRISDISNRFFQENGVDRELFFRIARLAFSQKRKMLRSSLRSTFVQHPVLNSLSNGKARPQELDLQQWAKLVEAISKTRG